jgi:hypothetical protein
VRVAQEKCGLRAAPLSSSEFFSPSCTVTARPAATGVAIPSNKNLPAVASDREVKWDFTLQAQNTRNVGAAQATAGTRATNTNAVPDTILGLTLHLPDPCKCGCATALIGPGAGAHPASLICDSRQAHRGWLPHSIHGFISEIIAHFGRLTAPVTVKRRGQASSSAHDERNSNNSEPTECAPAASPAHDQH